ncbi:Enolase-phosphatase E1 [Planctomycetes bacterium Pan216]|uniref:Enolase-phosphatase E1 n=1 Tax=Kolteria novifilia TaxID=2527975 RepID=A0A518B6Q4_9BACT|nr:Enolase-phosphatase E1 [Planctomycetes bacterium Pan216]
MIECSVNGILLDVEGTTSSIGYVYDVMFPFVREHLAEFLKQEWDRPALMGACQQIAHDAGAGSLAQWCGGNLEPSHVQQLVHDEVIRLMDGDVKATGLKQLQGLVWRLGYDRGQLKSHVFEDVPVALKRWAKDGLNVRIYSSGSVTAQRLFFGHTDAGDLLVYLRGHYDTTTGPKKEATSYAKIAQEMRYSPEEILFLSDVVAELDAARAAGMKTALVVRLGNKPIEPGHEHPTIESFDDLVVTRG